MNFSDAVQQWMDHLRTIKDASPHTLRNYRIDLEAFSTFLIEEQLSFLQVDRSVILEFLAQQREQELSKKTVARRLSALRTFFSFWTARGLFSHSPLKSISTPRLDKKIPAILTYPQVETLLSQPDITEIFGLRDRAILELFYSSGLRLSELTQINHGDIDGAGLWIRIHGKGRKQRDVPITREAARWIERYRHHHEYSPLAHDAPLFLNRWGTRLTPRSVDRLFKKYLLQSGLAGTVTPHTIRHTIATHWLENQMNIKLIQELLGHSSPSTTTLYTQVSPSLRKQVHEESHPRQ